MERCGLTSLIFCSGLVLGGVILATSVFFTKPSSAETFKNNMVVIIQIFSLVFFIPLSCMFWCKDRQKEKNPRKEINAKYRSRTLIFDEDKRQVKEKKLPSTIMPPPREALQNGVAKWSP